MEVVKVSRGFEIPGLNMKIVKTPQGYKIEGGTASESYIRIGDLQICWGVSGYLYRDAGDYFLDIVLPKPFLNGGWAGYTIVATLADYQFSGLGYAVGDQGNEPPGNRKTTTGFRIRWHQDHNMASAIEWIAIGRWK